VIEFYFGGVAVTIGCMRKLTPTLALIAAFAAAPVFAQSSDEVAKAAEEAVAAAMADMPSDAVVEIAEERSNKRERPPRLRNYRFIRPADYPVAAWQEDETGVVRYSVEVSATGEALSCEVTNGAELLRLASATCPLVMERAEFRPARNEEGEEVAGTFEGRHNWRKREPEMPEMTLVFQYVHDEKGVSSDCKFLKMENLPERIRKDIERDKERGRLCSPARGQRGIPYRDENGVPVAKLVTMSVNVQLEDPAAVPAE
jgi:hypothetical protein